MRRSLDHTKRGRDRLASEGVVLLAAILLAGCSAKERTFPVTGKVTLDGAAVPAGSVLLLSDDGKAASAELRADGSYSLQCRPGRFKAAVSPPPPPDPLVSPGAARPAAAVAVPRQYQDLATSGLSTEVKDGTNTFDIAMTSKGNP